MIYFVSLLINSLRRDFLSSRQRQLVPILEFELHVVGDLAVTDESQPGWKVNLTSAATFQTFVRHIHQLGAQSEVRLLWTWCRGLLQEHLCLQLPT